MRPPFSIFLGFSNFNTPITRRYRVEWRDVDSTCFNKKTVTRYIASSGMLPTVERVPTMQVAVMCELLSDESHD